MKENRLISYLKSKTFLKNLGLAVLIFILFIILLFWFLRLTTHHGVSYTVPDLTNKSMAETKKILKSKHLQYVIFDSVYMESKKGGVVVDQHPKAGRKVKKNRKIFLTLNSGSPEIIEIPDLVGMTFREAREKMITYGLRIGRLSYRYDIAKNVILEQKVDGEKIGPGTKVTKGTAIDLVLGKGLGDEKSVVPDLLGLTLEEGKNKAADAYFSIRAVIYDDGVDPENLSDTIPLIIYQQKPMHSPGIQLNLGSQIDIWVTSDSTKFPGYVSPDELPKNNEEGDDENYYYDMF
jgi:eukaryotic-like serine/threonine-protein kinase